MKNILKLAPAALLACSLGAQAAITITIQEVDNDVVISGSGSMDSINGATAQGEISIPRSEISPSGGYIGFNNSPDRLTRYLFPLRGPATFGMGLGSTADQTDGEDNFSLNRNAGSDNNLIAISVPAGYQLGQSLNFEMTFFGESFESLAITTGVYQWYWGDAQDWDAVNLFVGEEPHDLPSPFPPSPALIAPTPVPTLGSFGLMGLAGVIGAAGVAMTRRRKK